MPSAGNPVQTHEPTVGELDDHGLAVELLTATVHDFGTTSTGLSVHVWTDQGEAPPELPSVGEMVSVVGGAAVHRRISSHPLRAAFRTWKPGRSQAPFELALHRYRPIGCLELLHTPLRDK